jgi:hypothetical protein
VGFLTISAYASLDGTLFLERIFDWTPSFDRKAARAANRSPPAIAVLPHGVRCRGAAHVFAEMDKQTNIKAGWISVNTKAMSIHHEPKNEFEKNAAKAIAAGKGEFELVENAVYHRAAAIPLGTGCVSCHTGFFSKTPQTQRFAGLVISVPVNKK